jgi:hypothetical protein
VASLSIAAACGWITSVAKRRALSWNYGEVVERPRVRWDVGDFGEARDVCVCGCSVSGLVRRGSESGEWWSSMVAEEGVVYERGGVCGCICGAVGSPGTPQRGGGGGIALLLLVVVVVSRGPFLSSLIVAGGWRVSWGGGCMSAFLGTYLVVPWGPLGCRSKSSLANGVASILRSRS